MAWSHSQQNVFTESSILLLYTLFIASSLVFFLFNSEAAVDLVSLANILVVAASAACVAACEGCYGDDGDADALDCDEGAEHEFE